MVGQVVATKDGRTGLVVDRGHGRYTVQIDDEHGGGQVKLRGNQLQIDGAFAGSPPQAGAPGQPAAPGASAAGLVLPDGSVPEGKVEYDEHLGKHASTNFLRPRFPPHAREIYLRDGMVLGAQVAGEGVPQREELDSGPVQQRGRGPERAGPCPR